MHKNKKISKVLPNKADYFNVKFTPLRRGINFPSQKNFIYQSLLICKKIASRSIKIP